MLAQEYIQLVKSLNSDNLLHFTKQVFLSKYKGNYVEMATCQWENTYLITIHHDKGVIKRLIHIADLSEDVRLFIEATISKIVTDTTDKTFRTIECICLSSIEDKEELIDDVELEYGVVLKILDTNILSDFIEKYKNLKDFLFTLSSSEDNDSPTKFNNKDKILYDLFTTGGKIADIKNSFIGSYIQYYLLEFNALTVSELKDKLRTPLPNLSNQAFDDAIARSIKSNIIQYKSGKYSLRQDFKIKLDEIKALSIATERRLLQQFQNCLASYNLQNQSNVILDTIIELYQYHNNGDLATLNRDDSGNIEQKLVQKLFNVLIETGISTKDVNTVVKRILDIVSDSEYLNKMSATTLFTSLFNSNSLEDFLGRQKRVVFLDTQILLQLLCVDYQDVPYNDSLYEAGKILYDQLNDSKEYLKLYTTPEYIREVSNHLYEAYNLKLFINLPFIKDFGPSKNIFYNFYLYLNEEEMEYESYESYLMDLLNTDDPFPSDYYSFVSRIDTLVIDILNTMGVTIQAVDCPVNLAILRREYDNQLMKHPKSNKARENDILCMYFLSNQLNFINTETDLIEEPYLITLDATFIPMRKKLVENYQRTYWYIYPPLKFANRLSVMNLKLDSKKINYDIICMAETNFKASYESISMLDVMTKFFKGNDIGNKRLPRMLAKMKAEEKINDPFIEYTDKNNNSPIDIVLNNIHRYYRNLGATQLSNITRLFEDDQLSDQIYTLLVDACNSIIKNNNVDQQLYDSLNQLMEKQILNFTIHHAIN